MIRRKAAAAFALIAALAGGAVASADTTTQAGAAQVTSGSNSLRYTAISGGAAASVNADIVVRIQSRYGTGPTCIDADPRSGGVNGGRVYVWTCNGQPAQRWKIRPDLSFESVLFPNRCLDADTNGQGNNGTRLQLWACNGTTQQHWFNRVDDLALYNERFNNNLNTVVDRDINGPNDGANVQLWQKNFQPQQWWDLYQV